MPIKESPRGQTYSDEPRLPTRDVIGWWLDHAEKFAEHDDVSMLPAFRFRDFLHAATVALDLTERVKVLEGALKDLLELFDSADQITSRDIESYKWDAIVEDVTTRASKALKNETEKKPT